MLHAQKTTHESLHIVRNGGGFDIPVIMIGTQAENTVKMFVRAQALDCSFWLMEIRSNWQAGSQGL
jgi:hypothetical protein